jgi:uncharacterized protein (DUF1810 family)
MNVYDNYNLNRFLDAQESKHSGYEVALEEVRNGRKISHWMWYIFPQITGLGASNTSQMYAIKSLEEATLYLQHEKLGKRLIEISQTLLDLEENNAEDIFGYTDSLKLRSSMTLFSSVKNTPPVFLNVLDKFYSGKPDTKTLQLIKTK